MKKEGRTSEAVLDYRERHVASRVRNMTLSLIVAGMVN
jgi:hypothetical protein